MTADLPRAATQAAVLKWVRDYADAEYQQARDKLAEALDPIDRKAAMLNGARLATINKTVGSHTPTVTDDAALLAWVKANHPTEVVETVRPAYLAKLKRSAKTYGAAVDETTGEIVPGMDVAVGDPVVRVTLAEDATSLVRTHWDEITRMVPELTGDARDDL